MAQQAENSREALLLWVTCFNPPLLWQKMRERERERDLYPHVRSISWYGKYPENRGHENVPLPPPLAANLVRDCEMSSTVFFLAPPHGPWKRGASFGKEVSTIAFWVQVMQCCSHVALICTVGEPWWVRPDWFGGFTLKCYLCVWCFGTQSDMRRSSAAPRDVTQSLNKPS